MKGVSRRIERERLFDDRLAWNTARLVMRGYHDPKGFPRFDDFHKPTRSKRAERPSWQAIKAQAQMFVAATGGKVIH